MWGGFIDLIAKIPPSFWGVLVGAVFPLIGIYFTNRHNARMQGRQFKEQRKLNKKDVEISLKKEIFLSAIEAVSTGTKTLAGLSDINRSYDDCMSEFLTKAPAITKVYVVATQETLEGIAKIEAFISSAIIDLTSERMQLEIISGQTNRSQKLMEDTGKGRELVLKKMEDFNEKRSTDQIRLEALEKEFAYLLKKIKTIKRNLENYLAI